MPHLPGANKLIADIFAVCVWYCNVLVQDCSNSIANAME